jgi:anti-sigma B factor antagonist
MEVKQTKNNDVDIVQITDRLDSNTSAQCEEQLVSIIDSGNKKMVIDFSQLEYISSAGLRVLLLAAKKLKSVDGRIVIAALKPHIREVFDIAGFSSIFTIKGSIDEAMTEM